MSIAECNENPRTGSVPPRFPGPEPPLICFPDPAATKSPPPLPPQATRPSSPVPPCLAFVLSLFLGLFLADAVVSLADDSLILFFGIRVLTGLRGVVYLFALLFTVVVYLLMGVTPMIPKRLFLPLTLFGLLAQLAIVPGMIYCFHRLQLVAWGLSCCQVILGLSILNRIQGGLKFRWPLVGESQLEQRAFSWMNLALFLPGSMVVSVPAVAAYLVLCAALAVDHFTDGFLTLRTSGLTAQARKYVRPDGKTIQLVPMAHVAESDFYLKLAQSFPTNSLILMEGVSDDKGLLTNKLSYKRLATALGLAEQQKAFQPGRSRIVRADVDIQQFAPNTIDLINLVMFVHARGLNPETVLALTQYSPPPLVEEQILNDILKKRNRHLLGEIQTRLAQSENLIIPWGAAHMPEIAKEIQKSGFRLNETREFKVIRFGASGKSSKTDEPEAKPGKPK